MSVGELGIERERGHSELVDAIEIAGPEVELREARVSRGGARVGGERGGEDRARAVEITRLDQEPRRLDSQPRLVWRRRRERRAHRRDRLAPAPERRERAGLLDQQPRVRGLVRERRVEVPERGAVALLEQEDPGGHHVQRGAARARGRARSIAARLS